MHSQAMRRTPAKFPISPVFKPQVGSLLKSEEKMNMSDNVLDVLNDIVSTSSALGSAILKQVSAGTQPGKQDQLVSMAKQAMGITTDMLPVKIGLGQGPTVSVDLSKILPARSLLDQLLIQAAVMGIHVVADAASSAISSSGV